MNLDLLKEKLHSDRCPSWTCGKCMIGAVALRENSYATNATAISIVMDDLTGNREDALYLYSAIADCTLTRCGESYIISGTARWQYDTDPHDPYSQQWKAHTIRSVFPALAFIDIPSQTPEPVRRHIKRACVLYWSDRLACLNALRVGVEAICDAKGIPATRPRQGGGSTNIPLHNRLEQLGQTDPEPADILMAAKWLGNAGSHLMDREPDVDDAIDAFRLVEHALDRVYDERGQEARSIADRVNQRRGI